MKDDGVSIYDRAGPIGKCLCWAWVLTLLAALIVSAVFLVSQLMQNWKAVLFGE